MRKPIAVWIVFAGIIGAGSFLIVSESEALKTCGAFMYIGALAVFAFGAYLSLDWLTQTMPDWTEARELARSGKTSRTKAWERKHRGQLPRDLA